jgi:hypothetical protein
METSEIALIVSGAAFLVSLVTLCINSLIPFRLRVSHDSPTFTLYKITSDKHCSESDKSCRENDKTWWIPSFDIGLTFYNIGSYPGEVYDVRILSKFKGHNFSRKEIFYPQWIVEYASFQKLCTERFRWIEGAVQSDWYSFILSPRTERSLHLVLEGKRWDKRREGRITFSLQVISSQKKKWITIGTYSLPIVDAWFDEGGTHTPFDERVETRRKL